MTHNLSKASVYSLQRKETICKINNNKNLYCNKLHHIKLTASCTVDSRYLEHIWVEFLDKSNLIYGLFAVRANHIYSFYWFSRVGHNESQLYTVYLFTGYTVKNLYILMHVSNGISKLFLNFNSFYWFSWVRHNESLLYISFYRLHCWKPLYFYACFKFTNRRYFKIISKF